ncbi:nitrilase-related carbon-nitrogen hydrolase [Streptosporangium soli]|nr:hypothetical protein [Streptosporangium sp. KLBMP 9127]
MSPSISEVQPYRAVALQVATHAVNGLSVTEARAAIGAAIDRIGGQARAAAGWHGPDTRLVVLPEYALTGFPMGDPIEAWAAKAAIAPGGPEYDRLGALAQRIGAYLAVNAYETDEHFPGLYFQASTLLAPNGDCVLRYRRLHSLFSPSPYDVWDRYLDVYGADAVLPVARTEIGDVAAVASEEILYPELVRALALRGAEVFVHSTSEIASPEPTPKAIARRARACENLAYVVSANSGGLLGTPIGADSTNGGSEIIDPGGRALATAGAGESVVAMAEIDPARVRRERARPGMGNLLARVKTGLWAQEYARHDVERPNGLDSAPPERAYFAQRHAETIARLRTALGQSPPGE